MHMSVNQDEECAKSAREKGKGRTIIVIIITIIILKVQR